VVAEVGKAVVGQDAAVEGLLLAFLAQGHALLEGVPGTAKTLMVRALAEALGLEAGRIQFTPDLMPSDIVGTHVFDLSTGAFRLTRGPVFAELLLADEINRAPAKTQSALLEAMQERQVSIDGETHRLPAAFTVLATQNPVEHEGTYPLPEAQLDRFLLKLRVGYPSEAEEDRILAAAGASATGAGPAAVGVSRVATPEVVAGARRAAAGVTLGGEVRGYLRDLVRATRRTPSLTLGAGPRAAVHLAVASRWRAALLGRGFVTPDDVAWALHPVLGHRLVLAPEVELDGVTVDEALDQVAGDVPVPR
jgi:MoxR-like ATPase